MKDELRNQLDEALARVLADAGDSGALPEYALEVPRQSGHGDFACNAAMLLAKRLKQPPRAIAEALVNALGDTGGVVDRTEIAGPGFVNLWLAGARWHDVLREIIGAGDSYGASDVGKGRRVQVEFVSANPTGPLSTGHGRQAVLGDSIARLLEYTGWDVTREYYFNNGGRQMRVLGESVRARYLEALGRAAPPPPEALADPEKAWVDEVDGLPVVFPRDGYQGDYIADIATDLMAQHGESLVDEPGEGHFRQTAQEVIFHRIRQTLERLAIHFDVYFNEKDLYDQGSLDEVLAEMREKGAIHEADGAVWFNATQLGFDRDRVVVRSNGEPTYLLPDIAYHRNKLERGFERIIDVMGADHIDQFPYVRAAAGVLGYDPERIELVLHQFVTITRSGQKVKQSTRKATFITVGELLDDVGTDVFRFFMIERRADGQLDFDLDVAEDRNWKKNPAYYLQYGHARACSIARNAEEAGVTWGDSEGFDPARLELPEELEIVKKLGEFPGIVERAAASREPHHLTYYLRDVAGLWNPYVQDGKRHRVLSDDAGLTTARLALARAVQVVLHNGLGLIGLSAPERM